MCNRWQVWARLLPQEQYHKNLTYLEAETLAISILKQVMEEKLDVTNVEVMRLVYTPFGRPSGFSHHLCDIVLALVRTAGCMRQDAATRRRGAALRRVPLRARVEKPSEVQHVF